MKTGTNNISITHNRFVNALDAAKIKANCKDDLKIEPFKRMVGWQLELQGITAEAPSSTLLTSEIYFYDLESLDAYLGYMISLKQICHLNIYDDFDLQAEKSPFYITIRQQLMAIPKPLDRNQLKKNISKFISLLGFISQFLVKA